MCFYCQIFTPFRLLCERRDSTFVSIDIAVIGESPHHPLKPFKVIVYSSVPFPYDDEPDQPGATEDDSNDVDQELSAQVQDMAISEDAKQQVVASAVAGDRQLTQKMISDVLAKAYAKPEYGYRGVIFRDAETAPATRLLHPCTQCSYLTYRGTTLAFDLRHKKPQQYNELRQRVLGANVHPKHVSATLEFQIGQYIGEHLVAREYGKEMKLSTDWEDFARNAYSNYLMTAMNDYYTAQNEDQSSGIASSTTSTDETMDVAVAPSNPVEAPCD